METNTWIKYLQMETITKLLLAKLEMEFIVLVQLPAKEMVIQLQLAYKI